MDFVSQFRNIIIETFNIFNPFFNKSPYPCTYLRIWHNPVCEEMLDYFMRRHAAFFIPVGQQDDLFPAPLQRFCEFKQRLLGGKPDFTFYSQESQRFRISFPLYYDNRSLV